MVRRSCSSPPDSSGGAYADLGAMAMKPRPARFLRPGPKRRHCCRLCRARHRGGRRQLSDPGRCRAGARHRRSRMRPSPRTYQQVLEPAKRLRIINSDACRDNPFVRSMRRTIATRSIGRGLARVDVMSSDTLVAFAARAGSTASDGDGTNSPYTTALVKHLMTPGLDLRLALGRVRDEVLKSTNNKQEPFVYGSLGGAEIPLVAAAAPPPAAQHRRPRLWQWHRRHLPGVCRLISFA